MPPDFIPGSEENPMEAIDQGAATILYTKDIDKQIDDILGPTLPRSTSLPSGYRSLAESMRPIEPIIDHQLTPCNPGQDTTPTTSHVISIPNFPRSSVLEIQSSIPISSTHSSAGGKPPTQPMLFDTGIVTSQGKTSNIEPSTIYVPPIHSNVVNPPSS